MLIVAALLAPLWIAAVPTSVSAHRASSEVRYGIYAIRNKGNTSTICVDDEVPISVYVDRALFTGNQGDQVEYINGARVVAEMPADGVGRVNPIATNTGLGVNRPGEILFTFTALKEGTTSIRFTGKIDQVWWGSLLGLRIRPPRRDIVQTTIQLKVESCAYKVTAFSHFSAQGVTLVGSIEGGLKRDADGHLTGVARMIWIPVIAVAGQCSSVISVQSSDVELAGVIEDGELTVEITYFLTALSNVGGCPAGVNDSAQVTASAVTVTVPASGGGARQPQNLESSSYYAMTGDALVVATRITPK